MILRKLFLNNRNDVIVIWVGPGGFQTDLLFSISCYQGQPNFTPQIAVIFAALQCRMKERDAETESYGCSRRRRKPEPAQASPVISFFHPLYLQKSLVR